MFNSVKVQQKMIENIINKKGRCFYQKLNNGFYAVFYNSYGFHIIPQDCLLLDLSKIKETNIMQSIFDRSEDAHVATKTGNIIVEDKRQLLELIFGEDKKAYLDMKMLKDYGKVESLNFKINDELKPIHIYSVYNLYLGALCPVRRKKVN